MLNQPHIPALHGGARLASLALLAALALGGASTLPASAQQSSWEIGCAERVVQPGNGDAVRVFNCTRQKDCQDLANSEGHTVFANGCFGVSPSIPTAPAAAARSRPERRP